jgi:hypothetical protein
MHVNPLRHNGIIGSGFPNLKQFPCLPTILADRRRRGSPECLAFVQVRRPILVTLGARVES